MGKRLATFLLATTSLFAIDKIKDIKLEGLNQISNDIAFEIIDISKSERINLKKIDKSIKKLFKQGYFEDIWVDEANGVLTYHFKEKPVISKVDMSGYLEGDNSKEDRDSILKLKRGDLFDSHKLKEAKDRIIQSLRAEGYFDTVVESEVIKINNKAIDLKILVNKGENIFIRELNLCGNEVFDKGDIEKVIANKERDSLGWLWGMDDGKVRLLDLEHDSDRIKNLYMQEGYLDAKVSKAFLNVDFNTYNAKLNFNIDEGKSYSVESIDIELDKDVIDKEELIDNLKLKVGRTFNIDKFRVDIGRIKEKIANLGYAYVRVFPDFIKNRESNKVDVKYRVITGKKVYIKDVIISGNTRTLDRVIRREVYLAPKDLYSLTDLRDSINALRRTGYFEDVKIDEVRASENEINLIVKVKETSTGNVVFGGGYGSYGGFLLNASLSDKNIFGSGIEPKLAFDYSSKYLRFNASLYNPRVFDTKYSAGINLYNSEYETYDYTDKRKGGSLNIGKKFTRHIRGSLSYDYVDSSLSDIDENSTYYEYREFEKHSITPSITFNNTDDFYLPRNGYIIDSSLEFATVDGIEKDTNFIKSYNKFNFYYGLEDLIDYDLIFRYKAKLGYISSENDMPVNEKFYLGGVKSVRGYESSSISPRQRDKNGNYTKDEDGDYKLIGGESMFSNSIELSIPLVPAAKMRLSFFYDYGMIGDESFSDIKRSSIGSAVEWISPVGPIQLIFAKALDSEDWDRTTSFEFTLGSKF